MEILNKELLSYYELTQYVNESKCILNNETLDYLEALLHLEISALQKGKNCIDKCEYLNQLKFYQSLILYNMYYSSLKLINKEDNEYITTANVFDKISIDVVMNNLSCNVFTFDFSKNIPEFYLYSRNNDRLSCNNVNDNVLDYLESEFIISCEKEKILERFLNRNNLLLTDFDDLNKNVKIRKYPYANVYIKK